MHSSCLLLRTTVALIRSSVDVLGLKSVRSTYLTFPYNKVTHQLCIQRHRVGALAVCWLRESRRQSFLDGCALVSVGRPGSAPSLSATLPYINANGHSSVSLFLPHFRFTLTSMASQETPCEGVFSARGLGVCMGVVWYN